MSSVHSPSIPSNIIFDFSKVKAVQDERLKITLNLKPFFQRTENIVWKVNNAGYKQKAGLCGKWLRKEATNCS